MGVNKEPVPRTVRYRNFRTRPSHTPPPGNTAKRADARGLHLFCVSPPSLPNQRDVRRLHLYEQKALAFHFELQLCYCSGIWSI